MRTITNLFASAKLIGANTDPDTYHRTTGGERGQPDFIMSRSALSDFVNCPSKWLAGHSSGETNATKWGSLIDALILSPREFEQRFAVYPENYPVETLKCPKCESLSDAKNCNCTPKRTERLPVTAEKPWNNNATYCKEWKKEHAGRTFIYRERVNDDGDPDEDTKVATLGNARRATDRLLRDDRLRSLLTDAQTQVMVLADYHDRATGITVPFKVLLDIVPDVNSPQWKKCLADFKTARDASEREFAKAVHSGFYDWQAATYRDAYALATGEDRIDFLFAVQENTPPYEPALWSLGETWLEEARMEVHSALEFYCGCLATNTWPSYRITSPIDSWGALSREAYMLRDIPRPPKAEPPDRKEYVLHELEITP